ncbi:unnamed protein product [Symbiodinium necroappetens]|uniref:Uncharacterized protein n=1 Tax=Symbiodinium necroappetens TaxID=1628268 RepID=A0A813CIR0_9DINO|nr:unnamed protein product [Symbiodinium necroappetens]
MQELPGFNQRGKGVGKNEPFYQVLREVCRLVIQDTPPFVVACVTATQSARQYLKLPRVTAVTRQQVAAIPNQPPKDLLTMDMGGHGRALESLEESLKGMPSASASALVGAVMQRLREKYPGAVSFDGASVKDLIDVLRACLSGKVLSRGQTLGSLNPEQMELIRIEYLDSSAEECRIGIPYIWLQLTLSQQRLTSDLKPWALMDYTYFERLEAQAWQAWEQFNAEFRVLRSYSFEDGQAVKIGLLHRGAIIRPDGFAHQEVVNRRLTLAKAKTSCHPSPRVAAIPNQTAHRATPTLPRA